MKKYRLVRPMGSWKKSLSICTMVNDWGRYRNMRLAWARMGFGGGECEFLVCDNVDKNHMDGYKAVRRCLQSAKGKYVIFTHLDSRPLEKKKTLMRILEELNEFDPRWAVIGNAGVRWSDMRFVTLGLRMPNYPLTKCSEKYVKVDSLDENLLILNAEAHLTLSHDLEGYHLYGTELCDVARRLGRSCYVAQMRWYHDSHGTLNKNFYLQVRQMEAKIRAYRQTKLWGTNCTFLSVSGSPLIRAWALARACWLLRKNEHHTPSERIEVWRQGIGHPFFLLAYAILWFYKKTGVEKTRKLWLDRYKCPSSFHA